MLLLLLRSAGYFDIGVRCHQYYLELILVFLKYVPISFNFSISSCSRVHLLLLRATVGEALDIKNKTLAALKAEKLAFTDDQREMMKKAKVTYVTYMCAAAWEKITDVEQRSLSVVNAVRFLEEGKYATMDDLHDLLKRKVADFV